MTKYYALALVLSYAAGAATSQLGILALGI